MSKLKVLQQIQDKKLVAVVRGKNEEEVSQTVDAIIKGGITMIEITFTIPNAQTIIRNLVNKYKDNEEVVIGAGTCIDAITARAAILEGAQFIVTPHFDKEIMKLCNTYTIPIMPAATTVRDIVECLKYGASIIKLFPANLYGPKAIKSFKGPIPQADFMPTGGVGTDNLREWLDSGAIAVGTGGSLTKGAASGDFDAVTEEAKKLVSIVNEFKNA